MLWPRKGSMAVMAPTPFSLRSRRGIPKQSATDRLNCLGRRCKKSGAATVDAHAADQNMVPVHEQLGRREARDLVTAVKKSRGYYAAD
jgi:hypothetical protein